MKNYNILLPLVVSVLCLSCDLDRKRVMAGENKLEGSWKFISMEYKDGQGRAVSYAPPADDGASKWIVLTFIKADRTGVLTVRDTAHTFTYMYGNTTCTFTFDEKGVLPIEAIGLPEEGTGKVYSYEYDFTTSDHRTVQFNTGRQYHRTKDEIITDVKYTFTKF